MNMWLKTNKIFYFNALSGEYAVEFYKRSGVYDTVHRVYMKAGFFFFCKAFFPLQTIQQTQEHEIPFREL